MMNLSEIKGEKAIDVMADLIDPMVKIAADQRIRAAVKSKMSKAQIIKLALKSHKHEIIEMLAILDGENPETYEVNLFTLPIKLLELANDPNVEALFGSQEQTGDATSSTPASESTEEN